jgi:hypothetical protein
LRPGFHFALVTYQITASNASYNASPAPGASTGIGFQADHTGDSATPTAFALNGASCRLA